MDHGSLQMPIEPYVKGDYRRFGERLHRRIWLWAIHLGDDLVADTGTSVQAIGYGEVVWSEMRLGMSQKKNWGGIVVLRHQTNSKFFYSLYGHMTDLTVKKGDRAQGGQALGVVAAGNTPENGWWKTPHLHFAIYTGPWKDTVLPGYFRPDDWLRLSPRRTRLKWWHDPQEFIARRNKNLSLAS
jgi:murein DD-endopeptidase MepM/ murein hydrolase activator NlpD